MDGSFRCSILNSFGQYLHFPTINMESFSIDTALALNSISVNVRPPARATSFRQLYPTRNVSSMGSRHEIDGRCRLVSVPVTQRGFNKCTYLITIEQFYRYLTHIS